MQQDIWRNHLLAGLIKLALYRMNPAEYVYPDFQDVTVQKCLIFVNFGVFAYLACAAYEVICKQAKMDEDKGLLKLRL